MVEIEINVGKERYKIRGELRQWACGPMKMNKKTQKMEFNPMFFYSSLEGMLNGMAEKCLRMSDAKDFEELCREAKRIRETFQGMIEVSPIKH